MTVGKARTAGTLVALGAVLVIMLVLGWRAASSPFPSLGGNSAASTCSTVKEKTQIFRKEITVSVYNGTKRKGLADSTMADMEKRHFSPGTVGNAPTGQVPYVEVRSTIADDPAAQLVALQFKPPAKVVLETDDLGPGIDVVLGKQFKKLHVPSPKSLKLTKPRQTCLDSATPTPGV
jgi:hypothetical protein